MAGITYWVEVRYKKENINTISGDGELTLTGFF